MANRDIDINIRTSFDTEGGDQVVSENERLARSYERLAESARTTASSLGDRDQDLLEQASQQTLTPQQDPFIRMGEFQGLLYTDVAQQAVHAGDIDIAQQAMRRGYTEREPETILNRVRDEIAKLRSAQRHALLEPDDMEMEEDTPADTEMVPHRGRMARRLQQRIEDHLSTISANIHAGRTGVAERSLSSAENYLEQLTAIEGNTEQLRELRETLSTHREAIEENTQRIEVREIEGGGGQPVDMEGFADSLSRMLMAKGLGGAGGLGGLVSQLGKFLGPWGIAATAATAAVGGGMAASNWLRQRGDSARAEAGTFLDLGRQFQSGDALMYPFVREGFASRDELEALSYTTRDAGAFAMRVGMPRSGDDLYADTVAGLRLARFTGTDEGAVAGLMQAGVRSGVMGAGDAEQMSRILFQAVRDGTREGVSTAETFEQMSRYFSLLENRGVTGDLESNAAMMALLTGMAESGSRALQGRAGMGAAERMIAGLTQPGQPGMEMIALQALGVGTERMPAAEAIGLRGAMAEQYHQLMQTSPLLAGRFLLERAGTGQPELLRRLGAGFERTMGGRADLEFLFGQQQLGLSQEQIAELRGEFGSIFGALQQDPERVQRFMEGEIRDPQRDAEGFFAADMGFMQERLEFLDEESERLKSVTAATQEWVSILSELNRDIAQFTASLTNLRNHPDWWLDERDTRREQASLAERSSREREMARRRVEGETDLDLVPTPPAQLEPGGSRPPPNPDQHIFIQEALDHAIAMRDEGYQVNIPVMVAQAALESGFGGSGLSTDAQNFFGIKAGSRWQGPTVNMRTGEYTAAGQSFDTDASFRAYRTAEDSFRDYARLISSSSFYRDAAANYRDIDQYIAGLGAYATDPNYGRKLRDIIEQHGLEQYNFYTGGYTGDGNAHEIAGGVHRGEYVMHQLATERHRSVLEQMHRGADEESLIGALRQQQGQRESAPQGGEMLVRFEFNGDVPVRVTGSPQQAASSLQDHLTHAMQRWANVQVSPWNQRSRRG